MGVGDRLTALRVDIVCRKGGHWLLDLFQAHRRLALCSCLPEGPSPDLMIGPEAPWGILLAVQVSFRTLALGTRGDEGVGEYGTVFLMPCPQGFSTIVKKTSVSAS